MEFTCPHNTFNPEAPLAYTNFGTEPLPIDDNGRLFWHVHNFSTDIEIFHQIGLFASAFNCCQRHLYPWSFDSTRHAEKAQWHIHTVDENDMTLKFGEMVKTPFSFAQNPSAIAVQYAVIPGFEWSLSLLVNDRYMFDLIHGPNKVEFIKVILHAMLHGFGLGHTNSTNKKAIMQPYYSPEGEITEDEIDGLWKYHGDHIRKTIFSLPHSVRLLKEIGPITAGTDLSKNKGCRIF
jgi:hypothetical protein